MSETNIDMPTARPLLGSVPFTRNSSRSHFIVGATATRHVANGRQIANNHDVAPVPPTPTGLYRTHGKRALDIFMVLASAPVALLLIGLSALALWIEGGSPFYRQARLGKGGMTFSLLKLRTMVRDADSQLADYLATDPELRREWDAYQKLKHDPRITRVGNFLRKTSLDELPQLWNVLIGDMSLIGPRPMLPEQLTMYGDTRCYDALRPGITGLWQVSDRNESLFEMRTELDRDYNKSLSFLSDLKVLLRTVGAVMKRTGY
ncbi:sugar transferase [Rhodobacteraceae bacterium KMM 6894]|nr:sugar transferase [Rhodobacteraceae bacterium KMM 6894]